MASLQIITESVVKVLIVNNKKEALVLILGKHLIFSSSNRGRITLYTFEIPFQFSLLGATKKNTDQMIGVFLVLDCIFMQIRYLAQSHACGRRV